MSTRHPKVVAQIEVVDSMLRRSGVRSYCLTCIKRPVAEHSFSTPAGGCCQGCALLGPNGCTNKPLSCALWLCGSAKTAFPAVHQKLVQITTQWPLDISRGIRQHSLEAEAHLKSGVEDA